MRFNSRLVVGIGIVLIIGSVAALKYRSHANKKPTGSTPSVGPILIPGITEPEEMKVEPIPFEVPTDPDRMMIREMETVRGNNDPTTLLPGLNRVLTKYPDYGDGYLLRLGTLCEGNDRSAILSDIASATRYLDKSRTGKDSLGMLLSTKAKIEHLNGNDNSALEDLDNAIHADLSDATEFTNSGAIAPEQTAKTCTWTAPDMDALVQRFPSDFRTYLLRGLYYGSFAQWHQESLKLALDNFRKAGEINSSSALPPYFSAHLLNKAFSIKRLGMSEAELRKLNKMVVEQLDKALKLDPNLIPALRDRAEAHLELNQLSEAVADYDRTLSIDSHDSIAYNDRGLAKMRLGDVYEAISDFSKAIENKKRELNNSSSYENRAEAYIKTQQWDLAISDLTTAISLKEGGILILSNIAQFRSLYPEYAKASDEVVARKLNQTFYPNLKYEDFAKDFLQARKPWSSTVLPELYLKRGDTYLKAGRWHRAALEFHRANEGFPEYANAVDRWRELGENASSKLYLDLKSFDDSHTDSAKLWVKQTHGISNSSPYALQRYELNCGTQQIRSLSFANYSSSGVLLSSREGGDWGSVVPESIGETLLDGVCRHRD